MVDFSRLVVHYLNTSATKHKRRSTRVVVAYRTILVLRVEVVNKLRSIRFRRLAQSIVNI